jgi:hypothetical protein
MKGKISKQLEAILRDPRGREQLRDYLLNGKDGRIVTEDKSYLFSAGTQKHATIRGKADPTRNG